MQQDLQQARHLVWGARNICVLTGAGISAESGIRTFRGDDGLWRNFRPEDLATPEAFARDPLLVWEWYQWRRQMITQAAPNAGHRALVELAMKRPLTLITQNVDGLQERAGSPEVIRLHGDIWTLRCTACHWSWQDVRDDLGELPPKCECGGIARPGVVWFGEPLSADVLMKAGQAAYQADVFLVVGTSAVVHPAASLVPPRSRCHVIEINTAETPISRSVTVALRGPSGELLPQLVPA